MRLNDFLFTLKLDDMIAEAAADRYMPMVGFLDKLKVPVSTEPTFDYGINDDPDYPRKNRRITANEELDRMKTYFGELINTARGLFKSPQQITWWLRHGRVELLRALIINFPTVPPPPTPPDSVLVQLKQTIQELLQKYTPNEAPLMPGPGQQNIHTTGYYTMGTQLIKHTGITNLRHFFSQNIPEINVYDPTGKSPALVFFELKQIELEYNKKFANVVKSQQDDENNRPEMLIQFPDGSAWFNLNVSSCSREAKAMGHCGNSASNRGIETVLSYRTPVIGPRKEKWWSPHLTFILNTQTGMIGEMKGRGNAKPVARYHPAIIALLRLPLIKGIVGGGYKPENNFSMADLPAETRNELVKEKPGLVDLRTMWTISRGRYTKAMKDKIAVVFDEHGTEIPEFLPKLKRFSLATYKDMDVALQEVFGAQSLMYRILKMGSELFQDGSYHEGVDDSTREDLLEGMPGYLIQAVLKYIRATYETEEPVGESDMFDVLKENGDDIIDRLTWAIADGIRLGTESEAYKSARAHLNDFSGNDDLELNFSEENDWEKPVYLSCGADWFFDNADRVADAGGDVGNITEIKDVDEPYNGWSDYDEEVAKENAEEQISELVDAYISKAAYKRHVKEIQAKAAQRKKAA